MNIFATADLVGFSIENTDNAYYSLTGPDIPLKPFETKTLDELHVDFCTFKRTYESNATLRALFDDAILIATPITSAGNGIVCGFQEADFMQMFMESSPIPPSTAPNKIWNRTPDGTQFIWNAPLNKWLSTDKQQKEVGRNFTTVSDQYLFGADGVPTNESPIICEGPVTIVQMASTTSSSASYTVEIRKQTAPGVYTMVASMLVPISTAYRSGSLNIDLDVEDTFAIYLSGSNVEKPRVDIYYRERVDG